MEARPETTRPRQDHKQQGRDKLSILVQHPCRRQQGKRRPSEDGDGCVDPPTDQTGWPDFWHRLRDASTLAQQQTVSSCTAEVSDVRVPGSDTWTLRNTRSLSLSSGEHLPFRRHGARSLHPRPNASTVEEVQAWEPHQLFPRLGECGTCGPQHGTGAHAADAPRSPSNHFSHATVSQHSDMGLALGCCLRATRNTHTHTPCFSPEPTKSTLPRACARRISAATRSGGCFKTLAGPQALETTARRQPRACSPTKGGRIEAGMQSPPL